MTGLQKILKIHGEMKVNDTVWVWDYANNCPKLKSEMTKAEYKRNKNYHENKGVLRQIGLDKVEYGKK